MDKQTKTTPTALDIHYSHHAYPPYKYLTDYLPITLFKPTDEVLLKLIRAAVFIKKEEEFVFNGKNIEYVLWYIQNRKLNIYEL